jgi:hypothetical protein
VGRVDVVFQARDVLGEVAQCRPVVGRGREVAEDTAAALVLQDLEYLAQL